jgi:hypothetical protein
VDPYLTRCRSYRLESVWRCGAVAVAVATAKWRAVLLCRSRPVRISHGSRPKLSHPPPRTTHSPKAYRFHVETRAVATSNGTRILQPGTMLPAGKSRVLFQMSLDFSIDLIVPGELGPGVHSASNRNEYQKQKNNVSRE